MTRDRLSRIQGTAIFVMLMALIGCAGDKQPQLSVEYDCAAQAYEEKGCNTLEGSGYNHVSPGVRGATISGGGQPSWPNHVTGDFGTIGGGSGNQAGELATVGGGFGNNASILRASIGGGSGNTANRDGATVGGGVDNLAAGAHATVGGGFGNEASDVNATVGGGSGNIASGRRTTIGGGSINAASGLDSTVGGGVGNTASGAYATVSGGTTNTSAGRDTAIGGGAGNVANGKEGTIGGGLANRVSDNYGAVGGGRGNLAGDGDTDLEDARYATVGGGLDNTASGAFSTAPGGSANQAGGDYSFAAGRRAVIDAAHNGSFLFADSHAVDFYSTAVDEFAVRATGGVRFVTAIDAAGNAVAGVQLPPGSGSWASLSDRAAKTNFAAVDGRELLMRLATLPIGTWNYRSQAAWVRHIGPTAQEFRAAFGLGESDLYISAVDADGVALAAIQALTHMVLEQEAQISEQTQQIADLTSKAEVQRQQIESLEVRLRVLEDVVRYRDRLSNNPVGVGPFVAAIAGFVAAAIGFYVGWAREKRIGIYQGQWGRDASSCQSTDR